uniref:Uncharacterized protein n=1 Tax=Chromulina nebulosa TaxID=96789 RepID=A0A7S0XC05_9STRA|mmetsp:Transcript_2662/g.2344  ORF Transcript_2662/g.2344 Transcript_2662/m.2344 type:complete len:134 (+) Transcript_2662:73-474(+)
MGNGLIKSKERNSTLDKSSIITASNSVSYIPRYRSSSDLLPHRIINNIPNSDNQLLNNHSVSNVVDNKDLDTNENHNELFMDEGIDLSNHSNQDNDNDGFDPSLICYVDLQVDNKLFRINSENYMDLYLKSIQ